MRSSYSVALFCGLVFGFASPVLAEPEAGADMTEADRVRKGEEVVKVWDKCDYGFQNMRADFRLYLVAPDKTEVERRLTLRMFELFDYDNEGLKTTGDYSVVAFTNPRDIAGTSVLIHANLDRNDDTWTFLPSLQRVKRISSANQSGNFAGTEFSFEDMASQEFQKFTYRWLREDKNCGADGSLTCDVVEQKPTYPNSGYSRQVSWYNGCKQKKIEYFDHKNDHVKTQLFTDYRQYLGKHWRGHHNTMLNHVTGRTTRLEIDEFVYRTPMEHRDFTPEALPFIVR